MAYMIWFLTPTGEMEGGSYGAVRTLHVWFVSEE